MAASCSREKEGVTEGNYRWPDVVPAADVAGDAGDLFDSTIGGGESSGSGASQELKRKADGQRITLQPQREPPSESWSYNGGASGEIFLI
jgi:hypothetical protein